MMLPICSGGTTTCHEVICVILQNKQNNPRIKSIWVTEGENSLGFVIIAFKKQQ